MHSHLFILYALVTEVFKLLSSAKSFSAQADMSKPPDFHKCLVQLSVERSFFHLIPLILNSKEE